MADYTSWTETKTRKVYSLPSPTNMTEVSKVLRSIEVELKARGIKYWDDTVTVEAWDDEIRFSYEIKDDSK